MSTRSFVLNGDAPQLRAAILAAGYRQASTLDAPLDLAINLSLPSNEDVLPIEALSEESFDRLTRTLLGDPLRQLQAQLPAVARAGGVIIHVLSMLALEGREHCAPIAACEHAILGLVQSAARTYAGRARINALCVGRPFSGQQAELARAILALAEPGLRGLSGQAIVLDAGTGAY